MNDLSFFLADTWNGLSIVLHYFWQQIKDNSETVQGITSIFALIISCFGLYWTYKLFIFTRKKPQINLEYSDGKWVLKNVGDSILRDVKITVLDVAISKNLIEIDDGLNFWKHFMEKFSSNRNKKIELGDIGIQQVCEINDLIIFGNRKTGYSVFKEEVEIYKIRYEFEEICYESLSQEYTLDEIQEAREFNENQEYYHDEINESLHYAFSQITYIEIKVIGDGYNQTIKYMR